MLLLSLSSTGQAGADKTWPESIKDIRFQSSGDKTDQPALFHAATSPTPTPLIVFLHQWGGDYKYTGGRPVAQWCIKENWSFIQPDFRGPNVRPEAMGSDLVIEDIRSAVAYAQANANVDPSRIFLVGASGGGHAALLAASRLPGLFRAASVWVPIVDLVAWHGQCRNTTHQQYTKNIEAACGGQLKPGSREEAEAIKRSPAAYLSQVKETIFDINAGIHDGHDRGAVPVSHSFSAYNLLADEGDRVPHEVIRSITEDRKIPEGHLFPSADPSYRKRPVLYRVTSTKVRLTIFEGGHEMVPAAALDWLSRISSTTEIK